MPAAAKNLDAQGAVKSIKDKLIAKKKKPMPSQAQANGLNKAPSAPAPASVPSNKFVSGFGSNKSSI